MLRRQQEFYLQVLQLLDAVLLCLSLLFAHYLRSDIGGPLLTALGFPLPPIPDFSYSAWMLILILPLGPMLLESFGFYRIQQQRAPFESAVSSAKAMTTLLLILLGLIFFFRVEHGDTSRTVLAGFFAVSVVALTARDRIFLQWLRRKGENPLLARHVMVCGAEEDRREWISEMRQVEALPMRVVAEQDLANVSSGDFSKALHDHNVDLVVFAISHSAVSTARDALLACETEGIEAWISADLFRTSLARLNFDRLGGRPVLVFSSTPDSSWQLAAKRLLDIVGSLLLIILSAPLVVVASIAVWWTMGRPLIFSQRRSGHHGKPFTMYKLRTMISNAEQKKDELAAFNEMTGPVFKVNDDPRITPVGKILRRFSIDELPQLFNVLKGEMSLVGPRPLPLYETENFQDFSQRRRMSVRPGLTCLWQVSGRNAIKSFSDWVRLDLEYIDNWSLWLDIRLLLRTIPVVLFGKGAK